MQVLVFLIRLDSLAKPNTYCKIPFLQMSNLWQQTLKTRSNIELIQESNYILL